MGRIAIAGESGMLGQVLRGVAGDAAVPAGRKWSIVAAGLVGGIVDNMARPVEFLCENLHIALDCIGSAHAAGVDRLVYIGSSCMYPRGGRQPMREADLWTGPLEPTNEGYAIAKLAGEALCRAYRAEHGRDYRTAILCNLYGPGDRGFREPGKAHVIPALAHRFREAVRAGERVVRLMGTGGALREFMHVEDAARGVLAYIRADDAPGTVNIGTGEEVAIADLARMVAEAVGYEGAIRFVGGEDGMPRKVLDSTNIRALGWTPAIELRGGLVRAIQEANP